MKISKKSCQKLLTKPKRSDNICKHSARGTREQLRDNSKGCEKERLEKVSQEIRRIEGAFEALDEEEAKILCMSYVEHRGMEDIAMKEHISRATAFRKREKALENFTRALFGVVRS